MGASTTDPTETLERKIVDFASTLSEDELQVFHDVLHLAREGGDVQGFAAAKRAPVGILEDPCAGGEVTFPNTFTMLGNLHVSLHRPPTAGRRPPPP